MVLQKQNGMILDFIDVKTVELKCPNLPNNILMEGFFCLFVLFLKLKIELKERPMCRVLLGSSISHKILITPMACQISFKNFSILGYKNSP